MNKIQNHVFETEESVIDIGCYSDIGSRKKQEDSYCISSRDQTLLATVCDGMGGLNGGEFASKAAVGYLHRKFETASASDSSFYLDSIDGLDRSVLSLGYENDELIKAGTTIVSVLIDQDRLNWFSVGDSRIYVIRNHEMIQATRDHNFGEKLKDMMMKNIITRKQYESCSDRFAALTSYVGIGGIRLYDITENSFRLRDGDLILLMSDGLYNTINIGSIAALSDKKVPVIINCIDDLILSACRKSRDNTTMIALKYNKKPREVSAK